MRITYVGAPGLYTDTVDSVLHRADDRITVTILRKGEAKPMTTDGYHEYLLAPTEPALSELSSITLEADIVLLERKIVFSGAEHSRYIALVTERHARAMKRGAEQAARLLYVEKMLEELALLSPDGPVARFQGLSFEVDDVVRDDENHIVTILGTATAAAAETNRFTHTPYILGEV
jgi:hypothetical protein